MTETRVTVFDKFEAQLVTIEEANATKEFDVSTPEGEQDCRDWHKKLRKGWNAVEKVRKDTKADYIRLGKEVDGEAAPIQNRFDVMDAPHKAKLDEINDKKRAAAEAKIEAERVAAEKVEKERIADLERREAEMKVKEDAAKAEQEAKDQADREKQIAIDAAEAATKQAEQDKKEAKEAAEAILKEAQEKAEREKTEAIEAEKEKARQAERDREVAEANARLKKQQEEAAEKRRAENAKNKKHVESCVYNDIFTAIDGIEGLTEIADAILKAIKAGEIDYVSINY